MRHRQTAEANTAPAHADTRIYRPDIHALTTRRRRRLAPSHSLSGNHTLRPACYLAAELTLRSSQLNMSP